MRVNSPATLQRFRRFFNMPAKPGKAWARRTGEEASTPYLSRRRYWTGRYADHMVDFTTARSSALLPRRIKHLRSSATVDPVRRGSLMTFVVGGGPIGVERAGTTAELTRYTLGNHFRPVDPASARVILVEGGRRLLAAYDEVLGVVAVNALRRLGVNRPGFVGGSNS
ncbi:FAD-dependent oxidoreductase [Sphingomonas sp. CLY1604]|uniref:FAD-dependent oxidoreductase n=1 Tax=Sphingomonas sp. CLY1604 TaxID=3457786 RepID=UPI003FD7EE93